VKVKNKGRGFPAKREVRLTQHPFAGMIVAYVHYLPTKKEEEEKNTRLFQKNGNKNGQKGFGEKKGEGEEEISCLAFSYLAY